MPLRKKITTVVLVAILHQPAAALLFFVRASAFCPAINGLAWAEGNNPSASKALATAPSTTAIAQQEVRTSPTSSQQVAPPSSQSPPEEKKPGFFDLLHGEISHELLSTAVWLDSFFGDERYVLEQNLSYLRVRYDIFQEERSNILLLPAVDLRLVLPQLQRKTHLVFSAEPAEIPGNASTPLTSSGERIATTEQRNLTTGLLYFVRSTPGESFIIRGNVQLSQGRPVLIGAPRYRSLIPLGSWDFRFTQEAAYRTDTEWSSTTALDLERKLRHDFFFRTSVNGAWYANMKGYFYGLGFSLREAFDATHALDYEWSNSYQTRPVNKLTEVAFRIRYRHSFWREWLFFELAPQIRFPRDRNFDITPGILFRLEMFFGRQS